MKLSICIPVYNENVCALIQELKECIDLTDCKNEIEIVVIDDKSKEEFIHLNTPIQEAVANYIKLDKNVGRSKIRNLFLDYAKGEYFLFLDCDVIVIDKHFISKYIVEIDKNETKVIYGGRIYPKLCPSKKQKLSWLFGVKKESKSVEIRRKSPNKSFMTNNFVIKKELFERIRFNEKIITYGHEDTLFGINLKQQNILIKHIENNVLNGDIENNFIFLTKTKNAIENLINIENNVEIKKELIENITLLKIYNYLYKMKLISVFYLFYLLTNKIIEKLLFKGHISLLLFDFYKLAYYIGLKRKQNQKK